MFLSRIPLAVDVVQDVPRPPAVSAAAQVLVHTAVGA